MTTRTLPTNVLLRDDVTAILRTILITNAAAFRAGAGNPDYAAGHLMALMQVATALDYGRELDNFRRRVDWTAQNEVRP